MHDHMESHNRKDSPRWTRPQLRRLGSVRDIKQPGLDLNQGASGKGVPIAS